MSPLLGKLSNLIEKEYAKLKGVRKKLEQLRKELMAINLALDKYAGMENFDVQVKAWTIEMRELAYDMEDSIDLFNYRIDNEPANTTIGAKRIVLKILRKVKKIHYRHKFAKQMHQLQVLVIEAYERQKRYKLEEGTSSNSYTGIDPRLPALYMEVEKLVGIEGPSKEITEQLIGEQPATQRRVVSIVGSGGSGKTTLARQVYEKIKGQFSCAAFVSVSQKPNINNLMRELLSRIGSDCGSSGAAELYSDQQLIDKLRARLEKERTFGAEEKCPSELEEVIDMILHKCDGLPLAIITLASLLADKPRREEEWKRVLNIGSMQRKDSELEVMDKILSLSYSDLPHHMKNCFLYLSTFPEDHEIRKDILVWKWIAEGFIIAKQGFTLEEVAESYFYELINRSLVQPLNMVHRAIGQGFRVHDIVLNFIISRSAEENFLTIFGDQELTSSKTRIRRLSVWNRQEYASLISQGSIKLSHIRAISICHLDGWTIPLVLDLPVLRVLDLEGCRALKNAHLDCIVGLFHLRYLGLSKTSIDRLPAQIGKLEYLQTLDVSSTQVRQLPESIIHLKRLMRLVGTELILLDGFGNMESLQELGIVDGCNCSINFGNDLGLLSKLRVLRVMFKCEDSSDLVTRKTSLMSSLRKLGSNSLRSLYIESTVTGINCSAESWCPPPILLQKFEHKGVRYFSILPKWIKPSLVDLAYLEFKVERMEWEDLRVLESLPALTVLCITVKRVPEDGLEISYGAFQCLTRLEFCNADGPGLMFEADIPRLEWLKLEFSADKAQSAYGSFVVGIQHLSSLKLIDLIVGTISEAENEYARETLKSVISDQVKMLPYHPKVTFTFL